MLQEVVDRHISERLEVMSSEFVPSAWPEGCYGSAKAVLLLIGPSPGGSPPEGRNIPWQRNPQKERPLWNQAFTEPLDSNHPDFWGKEYAQNIPLLIEHILGHPVTDGLAKLYAFANFDWIPCGNDTNVPMERMRQGMPDVWRVIESTCPFIIASLSKKSHPLVLELLKEHGIGLAEPREQNVCIRWNRRKSHRSLDVFRLCGEPFPKGALYVRLPQHPKWMMNMEYAIRCAKATRDAIEQCYNGAEVLNLDYR